MSDFVLTLVVVLLVVAAVVLVILARRWKPAEPAEKKPRIIIHPKERIVLVAEGTKKPRNCPACWSRLDKGVPAARCSRDPSHEIHEECRELVQGQCPECKGPLL